jgi:hypothetical protein
MVAAGYEHCQHCDRPHWKPRTVLVDGVELCTHSEAWRFECEVRWALKLPDKARKPKVTKMQYLLSVEERRGIEGKTKLRNEMLRRYKNAKSKK